MAEIPERPPSLIATARAVYGLPPALTGLILVFPIASAVGFALALAYPPTEHRAVMLLAENRLVENLTVVGYLAGVVPALMMAARMRAGNCRWAVLFWLMMAAICFGCAGEEVSWGQQIFHYQPPQLFREANVQHETNIHNLPIFQFLSAWFTSILGVLGLAAIAFHTRRRRDRSGIPSPVVTYALVLFLLGGCDDYDQWEPVSIAFGTLIGRLQELVEMLFAFALAIGIALALRRDSRRGATGG